MSESQLSPEDQKVLDVIRRETINSGGIRQTMLRKHPDLRSIDPKMVTQIVRKLIKLDIVKRIAIESNGKRVYVLVAKDVSTNSNSRKDVTATTTRGMENVEAVLLDIPCIRCRYLHLCGTGHVYDPLRCSLITSFILEKSGLLPKT